MCGDIAPNWLVDSILGNVTVVFEMKSFALSVSKYRELGLKMAKLSFGTRLRF